jgi:hypothetical protein
MALIRYVGQYFFFSRSIHEVGFYFYRRSGNFPFIFLHIWYYSSNSMALGCSPPIVCQQPDYLKGISQI